MKTTSSRILRAACAVTAALFIAIPAHGQLYIPVAIGTPAPVTDEFGNTLKGSAMGSYLSNDLVQVYWCTNGIFPPDYNGTQNVDNPPVVGGLAFVGNLTAPDLTDSGLFSIALYDPRPPNNSKIFVRAFNAPKRRDATFYADSSVLTVRDNSTLYVDFTATTNPIDPRDDDGDGLNNSWEKSYGSDSDAQDTDGDGAIDGDEHRAGTGVTDSNSVFVAVEMLPAANGDVTVVWDSVVGKRYQVECMDGGEADPICYTNVSDVITATDVVTETTIANGLLGGMGKFRVRLVEP